MRGKLELLVVAVAVALVYFWAQAWLKDNGDGVYPSNLGRYHALDEGVSQWKVFSLQATVVGYREIDGRQYLVVAYEEEGKWRTALVFVTGEIEGQKSEKLAYVSADGTVEVLDFAGIRERAKIGKRVRIEYLESYPADWREANPVFCEKVYPACLYPALMAREQEILQAGG
jgi:hypothetical protein